MLVLRSRAVALALVLAMVLAACGGGGDAETEAGDGGDPGETDTSEPVEGDGGDTAAPDGAAGETPDEGAADPADPAAPAPATDGGQPTGDGGTPAAPPASTGGGAPAPAAAPPTDADALARLLRIEDVPSGYQKSDESTGQNDEQSDFEEAFTKCMGVAGADPNAVGDPSGQAGRAFSKGTPSPQNPDSITSGVVGFADAGAPERMVGELGKLFASDPGRKCVAEEMRKVIDRQVKTLSPTASTTVEAKQISTYSAGGGIAQLQLKVTVDFGAQTVVVYSDIVAVRAGNYASILGFTNSNSPFDPKLGQPIVDKAIARLAG